MPSTAKINKIGELAKLLDSLRAKNKIVLCHGVFDLLHIGHIRHFEQAKKLGDILVVTVTPDRHVIRGPHRPAFNEELRAEAIAALDCVDYVAINGWSTAVDTIELLRPHVYAKGADYKDPEGDITGKIVDEQEAVKAIGAEIIFTDDIVFSSSNLVNRYLPTLSEDARDYLAAFSGRHTIDEVIGYIESARSLRVLVVGEAIIDEYQYCEQIGKAAKDPVLAVRYLSSEKFAGGILAVGNHVANFCDRVGLIAALGKDASQEEFIRRNLNSEIEIQFLYRAGSPTIVKRRFVESDFMQKLLEVYEMVDGELDQAENNALSDMLLEILPRYDVVIVIDYGHGMLTKEAVDILCSKAPFLAVNTQINAGNRGLNTISKYSRADYISLALPEIMMEERSRTGNIEDMVLSVSRRLKCGHILVTLGKDGNLGYSEAEGFLQVPAFTNHVVDRVGAGDAVLALTALCVAQHAPLEVVGMIGNAVGAEAVATMGHRDSIQRVPLFKHLGSLLK